MSKLFFLTMICWILFWKNWQVTRQLARYGLINCVFHHGHKGLWHDKSISLFSVGKWLFERCLQFFHIYAWFSWLTFSIFINLFLVLYKNGKIMHMRSQPLPCPDGTHLLLPGAGAALKNISSDIGHGAAPSVFPGTATVHEFCFLNWLFLQYGRVFGTSCKQSMKLRNYQRLKAHIFSRIYS